jgi:dihydrofolate reductase
MRKIVLMMSVSVDGFMAGPGGDLGWQLVDEELHGHFNDWLAGASAFLDGRVTYELMAEFWPTADADPASPPRMAEFAGIWRDKPKFVFSRALERADWNTTVLRDVVPEQIRAIAAQPGGDMVIGGADLAASFLQLGLVDEFRIYVHPIIIGRGKPLFAPSDVTVRLRLAETRTFGSGVVLLRYARVEQATTGRDEPPHRTAGASDA